MLAVTVSVLASTGCTLSHPDAPTTTPPPALPSRPRDVPVDNFDPCSALDQQSRSLLGIGMPSMNPSRADDTPGSRRCSWRANSSTAYISYSVETSARAGAGPALQTPGASSTVVAGFPAVRTRNPYAPRGSQCIFVIDVADTQALVVTYFINNGGSDSTDEQACQKARTAAEFAMQTLIRQAGG
ncbi:DUF3558 domain-containing protein [Pseudonocardia sp. TRM90224]|uniref:DUF3558 domain-containing protein n=1 Tax=Pseudonocardia sp. TRM90224 TaxID=2812678 RepID=UPI0035A95A51